ncbi:hypothetical protein B0H11DRAFT_2334483 [Mycena galericulata]|nr:hypothetical protein B0H11DRAFT_2334483 [Mycena galericulata]
MSLPPDAIVAALAAAGREWVRTSDEDYIRARKFTMNIPQPGDPDFSTVCIQGRKNVEAYLCHRLFLLLLDHGLATESTLKELPKQLVDSLEEGNLDTHHSLQQPLFCVLAGAVVRHELQDHTMFEKWLDVVLAGLLDVITKAAKNIAETRTAPTEVPPEPSVVADVLENIERRQRVKGMVNMTMLGEAASGQEHAAA